MQIYKNYFNSYTKSLIILEIKTTKIKTGYNIRYMQFFNPQINAQLHIHSVVMVHCRKKERCSVSIAFLTFALNSVPQLILISLAYRRTNPFLALDVFQRMNGL